MITHQFDGVHDAFKNNDSVEISGFGKFLFNKKKAKKHVTKLNNIKAKYEKMLAKDDMPVKQVNFIKSKLSGLNLTLMSLKPKLNEDKRDIRGVEK